MSRIDAQHFTLLQMTQKQHIQLQLQTLTRLNKDIFMESPFSSLIKR